MGEITNEDRSIYGDDAMRAGTPDYLSNDVRTNAVDTIANILHAVSDPTVLNEALRHYVAERAGE